MPQSAKPARPIVIVKKKGGHGGHHGGAWKVAYADFVTAMMSLFIVLWLMNSTPQVKKAIAGYFNDPSGSGQQTGSDMLGAGSGIAVDAKNVQDLKKQIEKAIVKQADLQKLSKQVEITITGEGLKIELLEGNGGTFFQSGSPQLSDNGEKLLGMLAEQLKGLPNQLLIEGHTDAQPFAGANGYSNWELSSDRANAARRLLQSGGVTQNRIAQVRGYADQMLRVPGNPMDPSNRRISLIVQWPKASAPAGSATETAGAEAGAGAEAKPAESGEAKPAQSSAEAAPAKPGAGQPAAAQTATAQPAAGQPSTSHAAAAASAAKPATQLAAAVPAKPWAKVTGLFSKKK